MIHDPRPPDLLGAHVSTAGGVSAALPRARAIVPARCRSSPSRRASGPSPRSTTVERTRFRRGVSRFGAARHQRPRQLSHQPRLAGAVAPGPIAGLLHLRAARGARGLACTALVSHPGNFIDDRASGLARNAEAIGIALEVVPGPTRLLLEMTAGSGTALGSSFEEMAAPDRRDPRPQRRRVGVCVDTAHVFAAGYDLIAGLRRRLDPIRRRWSDSTVWACCTSTIRRRR